MSNFKEYKGRFAFHPGYYINEAVEASHLTQEDFAKRLDTTPKNLSILIRGEQRLSADMAFKLSRLMGTSVAYWLNLQTAYDSVIAEIKMEEEENREKEVFKYLDYGFFVKNYNLPSLPRRIHEQITQLRKFLGVSTLTVFCKRDMAVSFRSSTGSICEANIVKANVMVQIAVNEVLKGELPKYNKKNLEKASVYALNLTSDHDNFYLKIKKAFKEAGILLVVLPNIPGSKINGATKRVGDSILLMISDRRFYSDTFWFTLFHEIGHIINGDFGISFDEDSGIQEEKADKYAQDCLIPPLSYKNFVAKNHFDLESIRRFGKEINRDSSIVLGRLQHDKYVCFDDTSMQKLRYKYKLVD